MQWLKVRTGPVSTGVAAQANHFLACKLGQTVEAMESHQLSLLLGNCRGNSNLEGEESDISFNPRKQIIL
jgi:hypothetical protein